MANENLKPMTWDQLRRLPEYARVEYLDAIRREFGCGVGQMAEMLGLKKKDFIRETELLGMDLHGAKPPRDPAKLGLWDAFVSGNGDQAPKQAEPAEPETPAAEAPAAEPAAKEPEVLVAETGELKTCFPRLPAVGSDGATVKIVRMEMELRGTIWDIIGALEPYSEAITDQAVARIVIGGAE